MCLPKKSITVIQSSALNKPRKKVDFCKTELHFATDCGKVKIVQTDEKPPSSMPLRRKRHARLARLRQFDTQKIKCIPTTTQGKNGIL